MTRYVRAVPDLGAVPLEELVLRGVRGLLLDLDNTLVPARSADVPAGTRLFLQEAQRFGLAAVILSNGRKARAEQLGQMLGLPAVGRAKKPLGGGYRRALAILGLPSSEVAAIGDQFLTDGIGAWCQGMPLALVDPITSSEALLVRLGRPVDRILRRLLLRRAGSDRVSAS